MNLSRLSRSMGSVRVFFPGLVALFLVLFSDASAQGRAVLGGVALGGVSGTVLGLVGTAEVCNRTLSGPACPRVAAAVGAALGSMGGGLLGARDQEALRDRLRGAGYGAAAGAVLGYAVTRMVRPYGWRDAATFVVIGGAVGASAKGAGIGFGAGVALGTLAWWLVPEVKLGDTIALSLTGLAVGGIAGWAVAGGSTGDGDRPALVLPLTIRF